jgi:hypothetical protein
MTEPKRLFAKANELLDASLFEDAIKLYRELAFYEETHSQALFNLGIAWRLSHLTFVDDIVTAMPNSVAANTFKVMLLIRNHQSKQAFSLSNELLTTRFKNASDTVQLRLRSVRFKATVDAGNSTYLAEDFTLIWESLHNPRGRRKLLQDLLAVPHVNLIPAFEMLAKDSRFSESMRAIFQEHAEQLNRLQALYDDELK